MRIKQQPKVETPFWAQIRTEDNLWAEILNHTRGEWGQLFGELGISCAADLAGEGPKRHVTLNGAQENKKGTIDYTINMRMREVEDYVEQFVVARGQAAEVVDIKTEEQRQELLEELGPDEMPAPRVRQVGYILEVEFTYSFIPKKGGMPSPDVPPDKNHSIGGNCLTSTRVNPDPFRVALQQCRLM